MGEGVLDAVAEDPFEREHQTWPEREEREQNATHIAMVAVEPDGGSTAMELAGLEPATSWVRSRRSPN